MSVTVEDLLQLPSLRNAEVVAGRGGLRKIVSSISVLEVTDPTLLNDDLFSNDEFFGSEIVITAFMGARNDPELQCRNIRRLAEGGEVGLILYYVGVFMETIDQSLVKLANELDFTLICMPKNRVDLRYSEVIRDVMGAIIKDQHSGVSLVVELLERVARLPRYQQTMDTVIKMLSDRLRTTIILTDAQLRVLNEAAWPRTLSGLHTHLREIRLPVPSGPPADFPVIPGGLLYRERIKSGSTGNMELFIIRDGDPLPKDELQQAAESVQLAVSLWSQQHERTAVAELVKAILLDEPLKMRRLADLFSIDIASVYVMWVFSGPELESRHADVAAEYAKRFCRTAFANIYDSCIVLFMDGPDNMADTALLRELITEQLPKGITATMFTNLENPTEVRQSFLTNKEYLADAKKILPSRAFLTGDEICFARFCRELIASGEEKVESAIAPLMTLRRRRGGDDLEKTLTVFLLDADGSAALTAEKLFLHKNTIKYRLKCMSDCYGFPVGRMPASAGLYRAAAIQRLLEL